MLELQQDFDRVVRVMLTHGQHIPRLRVAETIRSPCGLLMADTDYKSELEGLRFDRLMALELPSLQPYGVEFLRRLEHINWIRGPHVWALCLEHVARLYELNPSVVWECERARWKI